MISVKAQCRQSGQSMVEFALVLPLLALLLFAICQWGFIFATYMSLRNAAVVGARYATLSNPAPSVSQIQSVTRGAIGPMLKTNNVTAVNVNQSVNVGSVTGATSVQVNYNLPLIIPFVVPGNTSGSLAMTATAVMR